jgi:hypothetical protein
MRTLPAELLNLIVVFQPLFTKASWEYAKALFALIIVTYQKRRLFHGVAVG